MLPILLPLVAALDVLAWFLHAAAIGAPLALVVLSPIVVVISWFHLTLDPEKWPMGVVLPALMFIAAHGYRTLYLPLLQARPSKG